MIHVKTAGQLRVDKVPSLCTSLHRQDRVDLTTQATLRRFKDQEKVDHFGLPCCMSRSDDLADLCIARHISLVHQPVALTRNGDSRLPIGSYPPSTGKKIILLE